MNAKRILSTCAACAVMVASAAAYEAKAKITMEGNIIKETQAKDGDAKYDAFNLDAIDDKSKNGIEIDVDGGIAGAHFELFYLLSGTDKAEDGWNVSARNTHVWFTPIDMLKVRIGYVGDSSFFVERVDEEKVANPFRGSLRGKNNGVPEYITNADVDEMGFSLAVTPIENLTVSAAIAPGVGNAGITKNGDDEVVYTQWGATAKYGMDNGLSLQAAYRDNGKDSWKVIRAGVGFENETVYAFLQPVFGIEYLTTKDKYEMNGVGIDVYGEYNLDKWKFIAHLPVTVRTTGKDDDPSYMEALAMVKYNMGYVGLLDDFTPYVKAQTVGAISLNDKASDTLALNIQPGTEFKVGDCAINVGFKATIHSDVETPKSEKFTWAVPFTAKMTF